MVTVSDNFDQFPYILIDSLSAGQAGEQWNNEARQTQLGVLDAQSGLQPGNRLKGILINPLNITF